ncbi:hypothetical protein ACA086_14455 [Muriicola sp. E247]|uniref:hypothetical protein n=1 Tax=Muriicola sp. E247 TaxID=3242730 RepID=UPI003523A935
MKKYVQPIQCLFFVLFLLSISIACNMGAKEYRGSSENNGEPAASTKENSGVYIEAETWRSWSPAKTLSGYSLVSFITDPFKMQGVNSSTARYEKGEEFITVQIVDGSTEKGKREIRDHLELAALERNYSSEYGYEKTLVHNGIKAKEEYLAPPAGQYLIKFMLKEQYGVSVKSNAESADKIWNFIEQLNLKDLK